MSTGACCIREENGALRVKEHGNDTSYVTGTGVLVEATIAKQTVAGDWMMFDDDEDNNQSARLPGQTALQLSPFFQLHLFPYHRHCFRRTFLNKQDSTTQLCILKGISVETVTHDLAA